MRAPVRPVAEGLARRTTRRGLFGRGADLIFGSLIGVAAGTVTRPGSASASDGNCDPLNPRNRDNPCTICAPPGPMCYCEHCTEAGVCAKPCVINTTWYNSGCWVNDGVTCCDCTCAAPPEGRGICGCTSDFHGDPANCPKWSAEKA